MDKLLLEFQSKDRLNRIDPNPHPMVVFATECGETERMIMEQFTRKREIVMFTDSKEEEKEFIRQTPCAEEWNRLIDAAYQRAYENQDTPLGQQIDEGVGDMD